MSVLFDFTVKSSLVIFIFLLGAILVISSSCYGTLEERTKKSTAIVKNSGIWFIEEGLAEYYRTKDVTPIGEHIKGMGGFVPTTEIILFSDSGALATVLVDSAWMGSVTSCYARISSGLVYEYWILKTSSSREEPSREIYFMIAKASGLDKRREIIHRTEKFFPEFATPEGDVIRFPMDNKSIHRLRPWEYPVAFKGTELEGVKVIIENKKYIRKQIK